MVTFAQAQERAEEWINGDVPGYQHREVRVREFELGFVVWAEDRAEGPRSDGGAQRLVIARDSGEATLWPSLPVGEVIRRYEEEYGLPDAAPDPAPAPPARVDLNQTSFLLTPPEWLQEAADRMGIPDRRDRTSGGASGIGSPRPADGAPDRTSDRTSDRASDGAGSRPAAAAAAVNDAVPPGGSAGPAHGGAGGGGAIPETLPGPGGGPGASSAPGGGTSWPAAGGEASGGSGVPADATPWAGTDTNAETGDDRSVPLPATVYAPQIRDVGDGGAGGRPSEPDAAPEAQTRLISGGSQLPSTTVAPALGDQNPPSFPQGPGGQGAPAGPGGPGAQGTPPPGAPSSYGYPQGPGAGTPPPGGPGAPSAPGTPPPGAPSSYGYPQGPGAGTPPPGVPGTQPPGAQGAPSYGFPQGAPQPPAGPNPPQPPPGPGAGGRPLPPNAGDIADAATSKAQAPPRGARGAGAPGTPPPPGAPGTPGARSGGAAPASGPGAPGTSAGGYVPTQMVSQLGPDGPGGPGTPQPPGAPGAPGAPGGTPPGGVHHAATMLADPNQPRAPKPPGAPGTPGAPQPPGVPGAPGAPGAPNNPGGTPAGGVHHAATMLAGPAVGGPGAPQPPGAPGAPGAPGGPGGPGAPGAPGGVHHAETMLSGPPSAGPGTTPPPQAPPGMPPGAPGMPPAGQQPFPGQPMPGQPMPGQPMPGQQPPAYGYPQQGQPTVGPGYQAVLRYRAQDGSEQQLIRRSAPGTPHPEWQILHELRAMNVPPQQVLELHTELESCELPGAYCARMIRESWPQARITSIASYGTDHASRQQGMAQLLAHQGELHQVADGPARPAPVRSPLPPVQPAPPIPPEAIGQELAAAFGPGLFRFDQAAVSRQGVPPIVAHTLVVAGLPLDMNPFFWAQAQPGRPVPTLAELAQERGVQPSADAGSYLVMGSDFGKAICVQYGTAHIVAVPVEAGPGGASVPPQFVNTGLPEFARSLALLGRMWRLRFGLNQEQAGRWTVDFQAQLAALDPAALGSPESWWSVLLEQMWDGLL
ncbi:SUKH-4 family immunity protein [Streptomyces phaeochromogenes]|uniref:SUKH-4 family immunity protein n=1 Tax=Streptomyces phaeochromogenes TaxID=1923 RepID=UPI0033FB95E1